MNIRESLRRPDWLNELQGLLLIAMVVSGIGVAANLVMTLMGRPVDVEVASDGALGAGALTGAPSGVSLDNSVVLQVQNPTAVQVGWSLLENLPRYALITALLVLLWRLVRLARRGDPFIDGTAGRLRTVGLLLVIGGPVVWVADFFARFALSSTVAEGAAYASLDLATPAGWLLFGTGLLAVGEIVRRGQAMRTELDGVV